MLNCLKILLTVASFHMAPGDFNQANPGIFIQCRHLEAGYYENSDYRRSFLVGYTGEWLMVGGVTGYDYPVIPYVGVHHQVGVVDFVAAPVVDKSAGDFAGRIEGVMVSARLQIY